MVRSACVSQDINRFWLHLLPTVQLERTNKRFSLKVFLLFEDVVKRRSVDITRWKRRRDLKMESVNLENYITWHRIKIRPIFFTRLVCNLKWFLYVIALWVLRCETELQTVNVQLEKNYRMFDIRWNRKNAASSMRNEWFFNNIFPEIILFSKPICNYKSGRTNNLWYLKHAAFTIRYSI